MSSSRVQETAAEYGKAATIAPAEQRVILHNITWDTYVRLLEETGDNRRSRMAYDGETLEIMSPQRQHEASNYLIGIMIFILAEELELEMAGCGQLTCKRQIAQKGLEPDSCFYIAHEAEVRGLDRIDLDLNHPPPDLMIEVDITHSSIDKLAICATLGVPEVWRYDGHTLRFFVLKGAIYKEAEESLAFPKLPLRSKIPEIIAHEPAVGEMKALREFRTWVKQQLEARK
ncbi:MAG TPA: Uma2 family endonuclease [Planctomycetota bacterium]|nr:Uma2 family endonuclease [Planctomycetota bacterium]